jgi:hypothetical protein
MNQLLTKPPGARASLTCTVVAGAAGNVLEWYDFGLFGSSPRSSAKQGDRPRFPSG